MPRHIYVNFPPLITDSSLHMCCPLLPLLERDKTRKYKIKRTLTKNKENISFALNNKIASHTHIHTEHHIQHENFSSTLNWWKIAKKLIIQIVAHFIMFLLKGHAMPSPLISKEEIRTKNENRQKNLSVPRMSSPMGRYEKNDMHGLVLMQNVHKKCKFMFRFVTQSRRVEEEEWLLCTK